MQVLAEVAELRQCPRCSCVHALVTALSPPGTQRPTSDRTNAIPVTETKQACLTTSSTVAWQPSPSTLDTQGTPLNPTAAASEDPAAPILPPEHGSTHSSHATISPAFTRLPPPNLTCHSAGIPPEGAAPVTPCAPAVGPAAAVLCVSGVRQTLSDPDTLLTGSDALPDACSAPTCHAMLSAALQGCQSSQLVNLLQFVWQPGQGRVDVVESVVGQDRLLHSFLEESARVLEVRCRSCWG